MNNRGGPPGLVLVLLNADEATDSGWREQGGFLNHRAAVEQLCPQHAVKSALPT